MSDRGFKKAKDVKDIAIELVKKTSGWALGVFGIASLLIYILATTHNEPGLIMILGFLVIVYACYIHEKAQRMFMKQFAKDNGFTFQETAPLGTAHGELFKIGGSRSIRNVIKGAYKDHPMRIFNYFFTIDHGRNSETYNFTVLELSFEKVDFPHILLRSKKMRVYREIMGKAELVSLEKEFQNDFELFVQKKYEIEAMQIFAPSILRMIKEKAAKFSIEFYGKTVCFFDNKAIHKNHDLEELRSVTEKVFDSMSPLLNRLYDDFKVLHEYFRKQP